METNEIDAGELNTEASAGPRSPVRTVQVLHELALSARGLSLAALATQLRLPKTSVFRLLRSLEAGGYVETTHGLYQLGPAARELGAAIVRKHDLPGCARQTMQWLASHCGETIILGMPADNGVDVIYSAVIEGIHPLRFSTTVGTAKPLQCSASGQTLLAFMAQDALDHFLAHAKFAKYASGSITTVQALASALETIRRTGIAVSVNGTFEGVYSIAAPVFDAGGRVCAGVSISAPETQAAGHAERFEALVREAGQEISRAIGYVGDYPPR